MENKILAVHILYGQPRLSIYVAVETSEKKFVIRCGHDTYPSDYMTRMIAENGRQVAAENGRYFFPELSESHSYDEKVPEPVVHPLTSFSDLYERSKDIASQTISDPVELGKMYECLSAMRVLASPSIIKTFSE
jgi:hypothetical protein